MAIKLGNAYAIYLKAIDLGNILAMLNLAFYYEEQNQKLAAIKYYIIAANNDDIEAPKHLNQNLAGLFDPIIAIRGYNFLDDFIVKFFVCRY